MKQKRLGDILYVFDVNPYEITQDTDATTIKVQEESYKGFVKMNQDLAEKIVSYNYHTMVVRVPEWAPYVEQEDPQGSLTFGIYGTGAADAINQIQVQNADNVILQSWVAGVDLEFPFQTSFNEGEHFTVEFVHGVNPDLLNITGDALSIGWQDAETGNFWGATAALSTSTSVSINAAEPSLPHTVEITSDIAMSEIMEQTPDHQTIVNTYTSPSSPFNMTVNDGNIVTVEFDNGEPFYIYDISPNGFFTGQWQNPDTGKYISFSEPISDDVNVTIQPRTYKFVLEGSDIHQNVTVKVNGETTSYTPEQLVDGVQVNDGDVIDVYPTQNAADYSLVSGATWDTDHWTATVNGANVDIWINYLGAGVNFVASWGGGGATPENVSEIVACGHSITGNDLTDPNWTETIYTHPSDRFVQYSVSTGLPTDMENFHVALGDDNNAEAHYAYKQTNPDTGEVFYTDASDLSGTSITNPGIWQYNNTTDPGVLPWIAFTFPATDKDGNAWADNTNMRIISVVSGS